MIRFGPAGIPLSCKGRTLMDGVEDVHALGLNAMEVQLIRSHIAERSPDEEEIGLRPSDLETDFVFQIRRSDGKETQVIEDPDEKIRRDDTLIILDKGITNSFRELYSVADFAAEHDVQMSVHSSYYVDLTGRKEMVERSKQNLKIAGIMCNALRGAVTVTQLGFYGSKGKKQGTEAIFRELRQIRDWWKSMDFDFPIGIETSGRQEIFGSADEVIDVARRVKGTVPVLNFAHVHSRESGSLNTEEDFNSVIERFRKAGDGFLYAIFSGVEHSGGNELRLTPIKRGDLRFEPLAELLVDRNYDMTMISSSPLLEHDAIYMKVIFERVLAKSLIREEKPGGR